MSKFLCISFSPTIQKTVQFENLRLEDVNRSKSYIEDASGKAINAARVLNQLENGCVTAVCPLGKENINEFIELVKKDELNLVAVETPNKIRECLTLLALDKNTTTEIILTEPTTNEDFSEYEEKLLSVINDEIKKIDAVLLAGSRPTCWSEEIYSVIAKMAKESNKIFLADFYEKDLTRTIEIAVPDIIKINEQEFIKTFELSAFPPENHLKDIITQKSKDLQNIIIVTRGTKSTFAAKNGEFKEFPVEKVKAVNTTACGDSFDAGFLYEYLETGDFETSLAKGTWCAACNAENLRPGAIK